MIQYFILIISLILSCNLYSIEITIEKNNECCLEQSSSPEIVLNTKESNKELLLKTSSTNFASQINEQLSHLKKLAKFSGHVALSLSLSYFLIFFNTLCHELGHAMMAKVLVGCDTQIYMGNYKNNYIYDPGIHWIALNPYRGQAWYGGRSHYIYESIIISLSGPTAGILASLFMNYILKKQTFLSELSTKFCIQANNTTFIQNVGSLIPFNRYCDGGNVAHQLNLLDFDPNKTINKIFDLLADICFTFNINSLPYRLFAITKKYYEKEFN